MLRQHSTPARIVHSFNSGAPPAATCCPVCRPGLYAGPANADSESDSAPKPRRPIDYAFLFSVALTVVGTVVGRAWHVRICSPPSHPQALPTHCRLCPLIAPSSGRHGRHAGGMQAWQRLGARGEWMLAVAAGGCGCKLLMPCTRLTCWRCLLQYLLEDCNEWLSFPWLAWCGGVAAGSPRLGRSLP